MKKNKQVSPNFIQETKQELNRIDWPTKTVVINASIIILIMVVFFTAYIAGSDLVLSKIILGVKNI